MSNSVFPYARQQFFDNAGNPVALGSLTFLAAGTSTPQGTFSNEALSVANPNPLILNAAGRPSVSGSEVNVYGSPVLYDVVLRNAAGTILWTSEDIWGQPGGSVTSAAGLTANQIVIGAGGSAVSALGTLGTTTTVLHGNASGAPTFGAVVLTTDVSGILPVANGGTGVAAVPGATTQVIFNKAGVLSGDAGLTYNDTTDALTVAGTINNMTVGYSGGGINTNTAFGLSALDSNTTGAFNTAIGYNALTANLTGPSNVAVGYSALALNTDGTLNTALGVQALGTNVSGTLNTALGYHALIKGTVSRNTIVGAYAGQEITTGDNNVAMGHEALFTDITGQENTAIGRASLYLATGRANVALGYGAGSAITAGNYNVVIGGNDGTTIAAASNRVIIADGQGNIRLHCDNDGNVGIGTATFGASANKVLALVNATAPSTSPVDTVQLFSSDISAGNCAFSVRQEMAPYAGAAVASTTRIPVRWNGTVYYLLATTVA